MRSGFFVKRLAGCDRLLLLLTVVWGIVAIPGNYSGLRGTGQFWTLLVMILWGAIAGVVAYSIVRRQQRLAAYGFSFQRGGLASLAILAVVHVYLVMSGKFVLSAPESFVLKALGAFMEEIAFRVIAIDKLILLMNGTKAKAFWAILASSVLWSLPHVVSKSPAQIGGIFLGGLFFGYIYYKSRSILLPAWLHSVANAGYLGGLFIAVLYCVISVADSFMRSWNKQTPPPAVPAKNTQSA
jgi:membrane protease YdiL (CAAX protease family)